MSCQACVGADRVFGSRVAARERKKYERKGPRNATRLLIEGLAEGGVRGRSLLEIGGGIGVVQAELFERGLSSATSVDASAPYAHAALALARDRGFAPDVTQRSGDFVEHSGEIGAADLVALDRVVCCYPDAPLLVALSADRASQRYGLVYPVVRWWTRLLFVLPNLYCWITRNPFRTFVHPDRDVDGVVKQRGFRRVRHHRAGMWQVAIYERSSEVDTSVGPGSASASDATRT
jgi:hypothetical protein